jgi:hypothetical protein
MVQRCTNERGRAWKDYGGRGISVCARWLESFESFFADMGARPTRRSLDRIDNDGGYWCGKCEECVRLGRPANCRWATTKQQAANKRPPSDAVWIEHNGERLISAEWARRLGISRQAFEFRLRSGWTVDRACTTPASAIAKALKGHAPGEKLYTLNGTSDTLAGWGRRLGVNAQTLRQRLNRGMSPAEALTAVDRRRSKTEAA